MTTVDTLFGARDTAVARDLKLNLKKLLGESALTPDEASLTLLALGRSLADDRLTELARSALSGKDFSPEQLQEAEESAAVMGMLNVYYRFKHFLTDTQNYGVAGLRMNALAKPALGKERFEMLAFAVSVLNGCSQCVTSHEQALLKLGLSYDKIHDLARLAAVSKGVNALLGRVA